MGIFRRKDSPFWWYRVQIGRKVTTGSTNTQDRKLAHRIYMEKHHQFSEEYHLPSQRGKYFTFFKMCDEYLKKHAKVNKRSWRDDEIRIKTLKGYFGDVPLVNIQPKEIEGYKASRLGYVKEATINRELAILKTIFSKAVSWGYISKNPLKEVRLFKEERVPVKVLSQEEKERLLREASDFLRPILVMALKTGMRQGEILNLKWKDVNLGTRTISVTHTKSKKLREIPIHSDLEELLLRFPKRSEYVFCDEAGNRLCRHGRIRDEFERLRKKLAIPDLNFHHLRHNFATALISKGADPRTVQEYTGHCSLRMLERYTHLNRANWRSAIELLGKDGVTEEKGS
ncbi:tyrosine-type recombinase/integrase [Elusimicrobiota bacterium]